MKHSYDLGQTQFDALLDLLSPNREEAGQKYVQIRSGLVRFFDFRGCIDADSLADEAINRGAIKLQNFDASKDVQLSSYFYGFALNILKEDRRRTGRELSVVGRMNATINVPDNDQEQARETCLEMCLDELPREESALVLEYYSLDRIAKVELRRKICDRLDCRPSALYTRISRIRSSLKVCIDGCLNDSAR
jgi:DNA-directed RNA polymerase specialized sigma24 family protein